MPDGWQVKVEDNTNCHTVTIDAERITSETLEEYLMAKYDDPLESLIDSQNSYDIKETGVYVLKPQDGDLKNSIYLKSSNGTIYMIRIYDRPSDSRPTGAFCNKINPFINMLISSLK